MREIKATGIIIKLIDGSTIKGKTNMGDEHRLSDRINRGVEPFLTVFDVSIQGQTGKVIFINKSQIMWAMPVEG